MMLFLKYKEDSYNVMFHLYINIIQQPVINIQYSFFYLCQNMLNRNSKRDRPSIKIILISHYQNLIETETKWKIWYQ